MQPDEQHTDSNVPDFFHLDPVGEQPKKSKKTLVVLLIAAITVVAGGVGAWAWINTSQTPEQRFYAALENLMKVKYVKRQFDIISTSADSTATSSIDALSDMSNPLNPKSDIKHTYSEKTSRSTASVGGEDVITNPSNYTSTISNVTPGPLSKKIKLNSWYRVTAATSGRDSIGYDLNQDESRLTLNSVLGVVLIGNFNNDTRLQLMNYIKERLPYRLIGVKDEDSNGKHTTAYTVQIDRSGINDLNIKAAKLLGINQTHLISTVKNVDENLKFFVDNATDKIIEINYTLKGHNGTPDFKKDVGFKYPSSLSIIEPTNVTDVPK